MKTEAYIASTLLDGEAKRDLEGLSDRVQAAIALENERPFGSTAWSEEYVAELARKARRLATATERCPDCGQLSCGRGL